jgi:cytochrome c oxidase subunit I+III
MFAAGLPPLGNSFYTAASMMIAIPSGVQVYCWIATLWTGRPRSEEGKIPVPLLFVLGFFALFVLGGMTGVMVASVPLDTQLHDSYFVVAHFHYTLFGGSLMGAFAAVYYWFPKVTGVMLREWLGRVHFALLFVGVNLTFFPMFLVGYDGMPRRVADYSPSAGFTGENLLATIGSYTIALGILAFVANVVVSLRNREPAGDDPWEGQTLEWATSSPPPRFNFDALPPIRSFAPLLDLRERREDAG